MSRLVSLASFALLLVAGAAIAAAQVPAGSEFRVNSYTTLFQLSPEVAGRPDGSFVVVWSGVAQVPVSPEVSGRLFSPAGAPLGQEFLANTTRVGRQEDAAVGTDGRGGFVVVWRTLDTITTNSEIMGRRFDRAGAPLGAEFMVNAYTTGSEIAPAVAVQAHGAFVVVWERPNGDGDGYAVIGRRFDAGGSPVGGDFLVNTYTTGNQRRPRAGAEPDGGFVVAWDGPDDFAQGIFVRRFDAAGAPLGPEQQVNTALATQFTPDVGCDRQGRFVVVWTSYAQDGSRNGVFARRFAVGGAPIGGEFRVNAHTTETQQQPRLAMDAAGNFLVVWESFFQDQSQAGVFGRRFDAAGAPRGGEFQVNTYTTGMQDGPAVAVDPVGNALVAWTSVGQVAAEDVFAQRYGGLRPEALSVTDADNGVLDVPDDFGLITTWRNVTGSTQSFQGTASDHVVPSGLLLTLGTTAAYGPVPDGAAGSCTSPCFGGALLGTRPAGHVHLSFLEALQPDAQGQAQRWTLHVGGSFSDVARTSAFYRFVETLLHHGVTGGCTATQYCPSASTTREQMAAFVLVAKEGSGYAPPACAPPNVFGDVPETSPFCRWIEELAARGVVSGCGGGNYCPGAAVTREQMPIFVLRTLDPALDPPACTTPPLFADVPASSGFCRWIEELARRGVVSGCGGGNYCPADPVTREQMGVFISVTFGLSLYGP